MFTDGLIVFVGIPDLAASGFVLDQIICQSGRRESNPRCQLGRLMPYHLATPAVEGFYLGQGKQVKQGTAR
jgi:hypothetical protein